MNNTTTTLFTSTSQLIHQGRLRGKRLFLRKGDTLSTRQLKRLARIEVKMVTTTYNEPYTDGQPSYKRSTLMLKQVEGRDSVVASWVDAGWVSAEKSARLHYREDSTIVSTEIAI